MSRMFMSPIVALCGKLDGKVVGPLDCSWFENDDGGLSCTVGSRSDLPDGWLTPTNSGILVVRLNGPGESGALSRGTLVPALPLAVELTDAAWLRPNWSVSDLLNPTVLPDKRYRNTVCPVCLTFKSSSVSVGLGIFLPIIHFWTCTGKLNLSKTWRKHLDSFFNVMVTLKIYLLKAPFLQTSRYLSMSKTGFKKASKAQRANNERTIFKFFYQNHSPIVECFRL